MAARHLYPLLDDCDCAVHGGAVTTFLLLPDVGRPRFWEPPDPPPDEPPELPPDEPPELPPLELLD
jgi:hypothetical protein